MNYTATTGRLAWENQVNKKEREYLEEVYNDCIQLERRKDLTQFGAGMGMLAAILLKKKRKRPFRWIKCN